MISRIWLYLQLVTIQLYWMFYMHLNLVVLPRHLIVNVFWPTFIILLDLQPKSIYLEELSTLQWRHNGRDGVSNLWRFDYLLNRLFRHRSKKTSKLHVTVRWPVNSPHKGPVTWKMFPFDDAIMYRGRKKFDDDAFIKDVSSVPFMPGEYLMMCTTHRGLEAPRWMM